MADGDGLQMGIAIFCVAVSLVVTFMVPLILPGQTDATNWEDVYSARAELEGFTGASMTNQSPWELTGVYLPYIQGEPFDVIDDWLTGPAVSYPYIGEYSAIKLDPSKKSSVPLATQEDTQTINTGNYQWYWTAYDGALNPLYNFSNWFSQTLGWGTIDPYVYRTADFPTWEYSGYRYEFQPILKINTTGGENALATDDGRLSIVWYDTYGTEGISGGLMLYSNQTRGIVANLTAAEIVADYSRSDAYASHYVLNFDGIPINLYVRFDPDVITSSADLMDAWSAGRWSLAFSVTSASNLLDLENSMANSVSVGTLIDTYSKIMMMELPELNIYWNAVLYVICVVPLQLAMVLFLSRFGIAGTSAGIIGSVLMAVGGIL